MRSVEIFLNFMISDANRNVLWSKPHEVAPQQAERMTKFWGDESWRNAAYRSEQGLFEVMEEKTTNAAVIEV